MDEYDPTATYISAWLMVRSARLTAAEITEAIGMEPDEHWTKGERRAGKPLTYPRPNSSGVRFISDLPSSASPTEHIGRLLKRLEGVSDRIGQLARSSEPEGPDTAPDPWVLLLLLPMFRTEQDQLSLSSEEVSILARMGAEMEVGYLWDWGEE
ncbi:MAG: DUF4279 domain-containing protein [Thermomicrobiales bacterium]